MPEEPVSLPTRLMEVVQIIAGKLQNELLLFGIGITTLVIILLLLGERVPSRMIPIAYLLIVLNVVFAVLGFMKATGRKSSAPHGGRAISAVMFPHSNGVDFKTLAQNRILRAKRVVLIGTGLNILAEPTFVRTLMKHAASTDGYYLEIYMADPRSPSIETRLIEEELGPERPEVGDRGILSRLYSLLQNWRELSCPRQIKIRMFTNYPTFALLMMDKDYFVYPYGMSKLGDFSPVLHFSADDPASKGVTDFFERQYEFLSGHALEADLVFAIRNKQPIEARRLHAFAVYFVPPPDSSLYSFGSGVLGYDVRKQLPGDSKWQNEVGNAGNFGFHLTICDALYFASDAHAETAIEHVKYVAERLRPFDLEKLHVRREFPDRQSVSIGADDSSGCLELLHHELVERVNRRALGSNYSLGLTKTARDVDSGRTQLMIDRYQAPYIMARYHPHFTLLTGVPADRQVSVAGELELALGKAVRDRRIRVDKLALMTKPAGADRWIIEKEINLGEKIR
jgi:hypothetical protein